MQTLAIAIAALRTSRTGCTSRAPAPLRPESGRAVRVSGGPPPPHREAWSEDACRPRRRASRPLSQRPPEGGEHARIRRVRGNAEVSVDGGVRALRDVLA